RLRNERTDDNALYESLRIFYDALIETGIREREMRFNAKSYMEKNIIKNTAILARNFDKIKIISTMSGSTVAKVAAELVNFQAFISNEDIFDNTGKLVAAAIIMKNGETKAEATSIAMWQRGIRIKDCTVIVNGYNDIPLLFEARKNGLVIASPYAVEEVKKNADIVLSEKEDLIEFKR
ncbi:MAG: HAD hydrolase family protein, partial [Candidatus Micrarchaeaceae archaeon]